MKNLCLESMPDERVLERVAVLVGRANEITAELLAYLGEVDVRGLHLGQACSSLFAFCVERLGMSESAAGKRITAARVARRFPVVLEMIARGEIHLTAVNMLAAHLTEANHVEVLGRTRHRSKRDIEKLVAEIAPRPDMPSRVVALPQREPAQVVHAPERVVHTPPVRHAPERVEATRRAVVAPLSSRRYEIRVTVDEETHDRLRQLQDLSHQAADRDPAVIVSRALELLLERTLAKKAAVTARPREAAAPAERTRHIPAAVRRAVWQRDNGQCAFVDGEGRRCSSTRSLEFHHVNNYGRGAEHDRAEIELRCRAHNQYQAVLDYGAAFMAAKKQRSSRAEEPRRPWRGVGVRASAGPG
jgi:5-methylcytosine-specific restriction endonuclease McrA